jgi:rare lipoprotein A
MRHSIKCRCAIMAALACGIGAAWAETPANPASADTPPTATKTPGKPALDRSGKPRRGKASYYGKSFHGKTMADGTPMNPDANIAASRTLPLGTKAEVTNLENGKSEVVEIRDRGPYVDGRIVDVSPKVAEKLDMKEDGVAPVVVTPLEVPQSDGSIKLGAGENAGETSSGQ